ncbi:MAG: hypothetical protein IJX57_02045 [Clostridia bacterium]|nr:hypothetical protein [Clostridia bacterium]
MIDNIIDNIIEQIKMAQREAVARGIRANAVMINDKLYHSYFETLPLICGLKVFCTNELPDEFSFAVTEVEGLLTKDKEIEMLRRENQELKDRLKQIQNLIQGTS